MCKRVLLIGPAFSENSVGGITVLFSLLLNDLRSLGCNYDFFDSNSRNYRSRVEMYLKCLLKIFHPYKYRHISLHGTASDYLYFSVPLLISHVILFKSYSLRKFAGDFDVYFESLGCVKKIVVKLLLKYSKVNFFETKNLVNFFSIYNQNTRWFPNVRSASNLSSRNYDGGEFCVVYISQIMRDKGVLESVEAVVSLASNSMDRVTLDIYGPIIDVNIDELTRYENINYKGVLDSNNVQFTMSKYHALLFPTYYSSEGYPGVIIEGFSVGIPVITTDWLSISEMFDSKEMLVNKCDSDILKNKLDLVKKSHSLYKNLSIMNFSKFESIKYSKIFFDQIIL